MIAYQPSAQFQAYQKWMRAQVCMGCGAAFRDREPGGPPWVTEQWCGCPQGKGMPDTRPDYADFIE